MAGAEARLGMVESADGKVEDATVGAEMGRQRAVAVRVEVMVAVVRAGAKGAAGTVVVRAAAVREVEGEATGREDAMVGEEMGEQTAEVAKAEMTVEVGKEEETTVAAVMAAVMVAVRRVEVGGAVAATVTVAVRVEVMVAAAMVVVRVVGVWVWVRVRGVRVMVTKVRADV